MPVAVLISSLLCLLRVIRANIILVCLEVLPVLGLLLLLRYLFIVVVLSVVVGALVLVLVVLRGEALPLAGAAGIQPGLGVIEDVRWSALLVGATFRNAGPLLHVLLVLALLRHFDLLLHLLLLLLLELLLRLLFLHSHLLLLHLLSLSLLLRLKLLQFFGFLGLPRPLRFHLLYLSLLLLFLAELVAQLRVIAGSLHLLLLHRCLNVLLLLLRLLFLGAGVLKIVLDLLGLLVALALAVLIELYRYLFRVNRLVLLTLRGIGLARILRRMPVLGREYALGLLLGGLAAAHFDGRGCSALHLLLRRLGGAFQVLRLLH